MPVSHSTTSTHFVNTPGTVTPSPWAAFVTASTLLWRSFSLWQNHWGCKRPPRSPSLTTHLPSLFPHQTTSLTTTSKRCDAMIYLQKNIVILNFFLTVVWKTSSHQNHIIVYTYLLKFQRRAFMLTLTLQNKVGYFWSAQYIGIILAVDTYSSRREAPLSVTMPN